MRKRKYTFAQKLSLMCYQQSVLKNNDIDQRPKIPSVADVPKYFKINDSFIQNNLSRFSRLHPRLYISIVI